MNEKEEALLMIVDFIPTQQSILNLCSFFGLEIYLKLIGNKIHVALIYVNSKTKAESPFGFIVETDYTPIDLLPMILNQMVVEITEVALKNYKVEFLGE